MELADVDGLGSEVGVDSGFFKLSSLQNRNFQIIYCGKFTSSEFLTLDTNFIEQSGHCRVEFITSLFHIWTLNLYLRIREGESFREEGESFREGGRVAVFGGLFFVAPLSLLILQQYAGLAFKPKSLQILFSHLILSPVVTYYYVLQGLFFKFAFVACSR